ncbi:MAG: hypothetical protein HY867_12265 [Chloroflexi bacterium]|nr:hypothetical protein [Chloroflexota bacterium]
MKNSKMKFYALVVFLIGVVIFIGMNLATTRPPSASELENFFGNESCSWPCWQGITPGVTKSSDALQLLLVSPVVSKSTVQSYEQRPGKGYAHWEWKIGKNQRVLNADMAWQDGIVRSIILYARIVSIGEIVDRFGPPEKVSVIIDCATTPEQPQEWCASFYYIKRGYEIRLNWKMPENADDIQFSPSDPISFVYLSEPSALEDKLSYWGSGRDIIDLRDWKGYGNLLELYER